MSTIDRISTEYTALAKQIDGLLNEMSGEMDASLNPNRLALRSLGEGDMGWTPNAYNDEAFAIWAGELAKYQDDIETLHHMAIMHHARAIDLEHTGKPADSDKDWEAAMSYWHRLYVSDAFWTRIADIACKNTTRDAVDDLRRRFPELYLGIHFDIAFHPDTKNHRARYHIEQALSSPYDDESKSNVRTRTYTRRVSALPSNLWSSDMLEPDLISEGMKAIEAYLELDPACVPALADALSLEVRLLRARYQELQALGDSDAHGRNGLLNMLRDSAVHWQPYFQQLVDRADTLDEDVRQKMCLWYRVMGEVICGVNKEEEAIRFYEAGAQAGCEDDDDRLRCVKAIGQTYAYIARGKAHTGDPGARAYCDRVRQRTDLTVTAHYMLANAYSLLEDFDTAEEVCRAGESIEPDTADIDAMQENEQDRQRLREMHEHIRGTRLQYAVHGLLEQATNHMSAQHFEEARRVLDQAIQSYSDVDAAYFLRAQCQLALNRPCEAKADYENFVRCVSDIDDVSDAATTLKEQIDEAVGMFDKFGERALTLRRKAIQEFNADRYQSALECLYEALEVVNSPGKKDIQKELSLILDVAAVDKVNKATELLKNAF